MNSRCGNWNEKNIQLYNSTVNYDNNTCQLNSYRTKYLVEVSKMNNPVRKCADCNAYHLHLTTFADLISFITNKTV